MAGHIHNYFYPETALAAVGILESAGAAPALPPATVCCGRPLYDFGYLDEARARLLRIVDMMRDDIEARTPVVFLEPSCLSVFRDELANLLPHDNKAAQLASLCMDLATYLENRPEPPSWRQLGKTALYHGHCHQKALFGTAASKRVLENAGVATQVLDAGCCGMAGSFGFQHVNVSRRIGERVLLPAVRGGCAEPIDRCRGLQLPRADQADGGSPCASFCRRARGGAAAGRYLTK